MRKQSLNRDWKFRLEVDTLPEHLRQEPGLGDERPVDLPHDWSIELPRDPASPTRADGGYFLAGRGTYRKLFDAPEAWRGKKVFVEFEGVYMNAEVFLNGNLLARHPYGYTTFLLDLTPYLKLGESNELRVVVDNASHLNSRWYSGSGLYRPVWLLVADPVHLAHWGLAVTTPRVAADSADAQIAARVLNESEAAHDVTLRQRILAPDGEQIAKATDSATLAAGADHTFSATIAVSHPKLWSPDTPSLYRLETEVSVGDAVLDSETTTFGIRSLSFSVDKGFLLNGQPLKLRGGCVHHDHGLLGADLLSPSRGAQGRDPQGQRLQRPPLRPQSARPRPSSTPATASGCS